jgi:hypothetical protein
MQKFKPQVTRTDLATGQIEVLADSDQGRPFRRPRRHDRRQGSLLPTGAEKYAAIDGKRMHKDVVAQALISRRYRDQVPPKFWGRIIGTSADAESAEWLARRFREIGLSEVRIQPFDLALQWMPQAWEVAVTSGGASRELDSAQPHYAAAPTPASGLEVRRYMPGSAVKRTTPARTRRGKRSSNRETPATNPWTGLEASTRLRKDH